MRTAFCHILNYAFICNIAGIIFFSVFILRISHIGLLSVHQLAPVPVAVKDESKYHSFWLRMFVHIRILLLLLCHAFFSLCVCFVCAVHPFQLVISSNVEEATPKTMPVHRFQEQHSWRTIQVIYWSHLLIFFLRRNFYLSLNIYICMFE